MACLEADPIAKTAAPARIPLPSAHSQFVPVVALHRTYSSPRFVKRSRLFQAKTKNAAVPVAPTIPFLLPGDARNCQLPSRSNQNKTSRYSPFFRFIENPDILSPDGQDCCQSPVFIFSVKRFGLGTPNAPECCCPFVLSRPEW